jgi:CheY-like chemotaxis protein
MASFNVLYAEDEFTNRKLLEIQLRKASLSCDLAVDGIEALVKVRNNNYDVIILDQYMPGMNGDVLAREIQSFKPDIPLIAITSDDQELEFLRTVGFREVFIKPLRGNDHIETIKSFVKQ